MSLPQYNQENPYNDEIEEFNKEVNKIEKFMDIIIFSIIASVQLFVLMRIKFKLDQAAWVTMGTYFGVALFGMLQQWMVNQSSSKILFEVQRICRFTIWLIHAYFIFNMKEVHSMLTCENPESFKSQRRRDRILYYFYISMAVPYGISLIINIIMISIRGYDVEQEITLLMQIWVGAVGIAKLFLDIYLYFLFLKLFSFFFKMKRDVLEQEGESLTIFHKLVFLWGLLIWFLNAYTSIVTFLRNMYLALFASYQHDLTFSQLIILDTFVIAPLIHMLSCITLSYLFYHQGMQRGHSARKRTMYSAVQPSGHIQTDEEVNLLDFVNQESSVKFEMTKQQFSESLGQGSLLQNTYRNHPDFTNMNKIRTSIDDSDSDEENEDIHDEEFKTNYFKQFLYAQMNVNKSNALSSNLISKK